MNYGDLFRVTLPGSALELAALIAIAVDLVLLRRSAMRLRMAVGAILGTLGCLGGLLALHSVAGTRYIYDGQTILSLNGTATVASAGILILTAVSLLLLWHENFTRHVGEYIAVVLMAASGGLIVAAAEDLLVIFIGLELLSLGLYILTAFNKTSGKSAEAALKYYLFGGMSAAFLLFGFSYLYGLSGSTNVHQIACAISQQGASPLLYAAWILIIAGLGFKVAAVPFHLWAPDAYEGAPAPAAAFIASVSKVASFALLATLSLNWLTQAGSLNGAPAVLESALAAFYRTWPQLAGMFAILAALSMVAGNLAALAQTSVRRLLAYSAIAHAGYMLLAFSTQPVYRGGSALAFFHSTSQFAYGSAQSVLYYVLTYGLTTIAAFAVISVVEQATGSDNIESFAGLSRRAPLLSVVLLVLFLSLAGIPPLVGFWAKFNLFVAVLSVGSGVVPFTLVALAIAMSCVSLFYYLQVLKRAFVLPPVDDAPIKTHPLTLFVLVAIALGVIATGCFPQIIQNWIASAY